MVVDKHFGLDVGSVKRHTKTPLECRALWGRAVLQMKCLFQLQALGAKISVPEVTPACPHHDFLDPESHPISKRFWPSATDIFPLQYLPA